MFLFFSPGFKQHTTKVNPAAADVCCTYDVCYLPTQGPALHPRLAVHLPMLP